ncbi:MAG: hypothetical protein IPM81_01875 [Saprospirales bacterium]|nr:hypothetical protein [Saprospirales bacterium]
MFSLWLLIDTFIHNSEPASEANKSLSRWFVEMVDDSTSTQIGIITGGFFFSASFDACKRAAGIKNIPDNEIKKAGYRIKIPC